MTKYLISTLGLFVLLLLHGCSTVSEPRPVPPSHAVVMSKPPKAIAQPATIQRPADTGIEWVTNISDLKSRHRFQLAQHIIEVDSTTRYYDGSATDIKVGARLRVVGVYRGGVVVANEVYIERPVRSMSVKTATDRRKPSARSGQSRASGAARPNAEQARVSTAARETPSPAKSNARSTGIPTPSVAAVKARESQSAKAEPSLRVLPPVVPEQVAAGPSPTKDFSHLVFDDRILPMSLDRGWTLDRQQDVVDGTRRCMLLSPAVTIFDGYYPAKLWLRINPIRAWVKTDSNIDTSYPAQGLRVDGGALVPFAEGLLNEQTAYTTAPVLRSMAGGRTLSVALGFWPTWPKTKTQTARLDLAGFANAYAALQACSQQQQQAARK